MTETIHTQLFIDGNWQSSSSGDEYAIHNPARPDEVVGFAANANVDDVDLACKAAHNAFPSWTALSYQERANYLRKVADHLVADADELKSRIHLFTREHGKILKEAAIEMTRFGDRFTLSANYAERLEQDEKITGGRFDTIVTKQARGVAALVVPWNWPLSILGAKLPQALIAGNTVVVKPSRESALAPTLTIARVAQVLPKGVVNVLTGESSRIGDPLITHPLVRKINFTGSIPVGRHIMKSAAANLTPVTLELGGNDAGLLLDDVELNPSVFMKMYMASFMSTGQICMALKRIYVHRSRFQEVVDGLTEVASKQSIGDGLLPETTMGPLNNKSQYNIVKAMIEQAKQAGAQVLELGDVPDQKMYDDGYFQKPTLVINPDPSLDIVREEQFGPVVPIIPFDDDEQAISFANDSEFGLCSSVWTPDRERALSIAKRLQAGYTYLNGHGPLAQDDRAPFGGVKNSGMGRNLGYEGIQEFLNPHAISSPSGWLF